MVPRPTRFGRRPRRAAGSGTKRPPLAKSVSRRPTGPSSPPYGLDTADLEFIYPVPQRLRDHRGNHSRDIAAEFRDFLNR